jgi:hypothetical protein
MDYLLEADEFEDLEVATSDARFVAIYTPAVYESRAKFGLSVPLMDLPPELHGQVVSRMRETDEQPWVHLHGSLRPEVVPVLAPPSGAVGWSAQGTPEHTRRCEMKLVELLQRLDARNLRHDRLFAGRSLWLTVRGQRMDESTMPRLWSNMDRGRLRELHGKYRLSITQVAVTLEADE